MSDLFQSSIPERGDDIEDTDADESNDASSPSGSEELRAQNIEVNNTQYIDLIQFVESY